MAEEWAVCPSPSTRTRSASAKRLIHAMRDQQHRRLVALPQPQYQPVHRDPRQRVQGAERLIEWQQRRVPTSARASETRCASPPDRVSGQAETRSASPTSSSAATATCLGLASRSPSVNVVEHPLPRRKARLLERHSHRLGHGQLTRHVMVKPGERPQQR